MSGRRRVSRGRAPWFSRTLVVLTLVSLCQDAASDLMYPLLPVFLTGVLAAPPVVLGLIEGIADATAGVTRYFAGKWSDRRGRKPFIAVGYGLAAAGKVLVAAAVVWPMVLAGRVVDRFGKGMRSAPRDALIAEGTPDDALGRAFGFHRAGDTLGAVIGPLLGLVALTVVGNDIRAAMWWAFVPAVISTLLVAFVREPRARLRKHDTQVDPADPPAGADPVSGPLPTRFWFVAAMLALVALVNFSDALLLLRVAELGFGVRDVVWAYVLFNLVHTTASFPAGMLADRWPRHRVYALGLVAFGVAYLGLGLVHRGAPVFLLVGLYGIFPACTDGVGKAWISSLVDRAVVGRAQGVFQAMNTTAVLVAGLWAGLLWRTGAGDGVVPLVVAGSITLIAAVILATVGAPDGIDVRSRRSRRGAPSSS